MLRYLAGRLLRALLTIFLVITFAFFCVDANVTLLLQEVRGWSAFAAGIALYAARHPDDGVRNLVLMATPVNFDEMGAMVAALREGREPPTRAEPGDCLPVREQVSAIPALLYEFLRPNWSPRDAFDAASKTGGCSRNAAVQDRGTGCPTADPAIREAMQSLANMGLVSISHGERARVQELTAQSIIRQDRVSQARSTPARPRWSTTHQSEPATDGAWASS